MESGTRKCKGWLGTTCTIPFKTIWMLVTVISWAVLDPCQKTPPGPLPSSTIAISRVQCVTLTIWIQCTRQIWAQVRWSPWDVYRCHLVVQCKACRRFTGIILFHFKVAKILNYWQSLEIKWKSINTWFNIQSFPVNEIVMFKWFICTAKMSVCLEQINDMRMDDFGCLYLQCKRCWRILR
jgi:hypothetical protein